MLSAAVKLLARSMLWMTLSAVIMLGAMRYGPPLLAAALPEDMRPAAENLANFDPGRIAEALREIRRALE